MTRTPQTSALTSDARDAAAIILLMNSENTKKILNSFSQDEVTQLAGLTMNLGTVDFNEVAPIVERFHARLEMEAPLVGTKGATIGLLSTALPKNIADNVIGKLFGSERSLWQRLQDLSPELVAKTFSSEAPQVIGYVLKNLDQTFAAAVLDKFDEDLRLKAVLAMVHAKEPHPSVSEILTQTIESKISSAGSEQVDETNIESVAAILNAMPTTESKKAMEMIQENDPTAMKSLESRIFAFDDLIDLQTESLKQVLESVPADKIALSLYGTSDKFCEVVFSGLGMRARRMVEAELSSQDSPQQAEIESARRLIVNTLLRIRKEASRT